MAVGQERQAEEVRPLKTLMKRASMVGWNSKLWIKLDYFDLFGGPYRIPGWSPEVDSFLFVKHLYFG